MIGDKEVSGLTKKDMINNIGFVAQNPFIFDGTIEENILYSCRAKIGDNGQNEDNEGMPTLDDIIAVLHQTGIFVDVLRFGLNAILTHDKNAELVEAIVRIRKSFQQDYGAELADYVEFFDENKYLYHSSVAGNLTFGAPNKSEFTNQNLAKSDYFLKFLNTADLTRPLLSLGSTLCRQTVDILGNLPPDAVFFEQSPINADELEEFKILEEHLRKKRLHELDAEDHHKLLELALRFTPGIHKMAALPEILEMLILEGRALFRQNIAEDDPGAFTLYQMSEYIYSQTILNNIFFGKTKTSNPKAQEIIDQSIIGLLIEEDLLEAIIEIGMHYQVGTKGDKLSGGQQQKLAIARIFLKAPRILIMDEATSALDNKAQKRIQNLLETRWKKNNTVVSVVHRLDTIKNYDKVAVMKAGKILETGTYDELMARKGMLYELVGFK
jgi:ABC-type multidrug transport system fused ATPase/permease subunit